MAPPEYLLRDCPETEVPMRVNGDLVIKSIALRADLKRCNADKASLRQWSADMQKR